VSLNAPHIGRYRRRFFWFAEPGNDLTGFRGCKVSIAELMDCDVLTFCAPDIGWVDAAGNDATQPFRFFARAFQGVIPAMCANRVPTLSAAYAVFQDIDFV
jgi:hypothetical protein